MRRIAAATFALLCACSRPAEESRGRPAGTAVAPSWTRVSYTVQKAGLATVVFEGESGEKIQGDTTVLGGTIAFDSADFLSATGTISADLAALGTLSTDGNHTSWAEAARTALGAEKSCAECMYAAFKIGQVESAEPRNLAEAPLVHGERRVHLVVSGSFSLHGVSVPMRVHADAYFVGDPKAPAGFRFVTVPEEPLAIRLSAYRLAPFREGPRLRDAVQFSAGGEAMRRP